MIKPYVTQKFAVRLTENIPIPSIKDVLMCGDFITSNFNEENRTTQRYHHVKAYRDQPSLLLNAPTSHADAPSGTLSLKNFGYFFLPIDALLPKVGAGIKIAGVVAGLSGWGDYFDAAMKSAFAGPDQNWRIIAALNDPGCFAIQAPLLVETQQDIIENVGWRLTLTTADKLGNHVSFHFFSEFRWNDFIVLAWQLRFRCELFYLSFAIFNHYAPAETALSWQKMWFGTASSKERKYIKKLLLQNGLTIEAIRYQAMYHLQHFRNIPEYKEPIDPVDAVVGFFRGKKRLTIEEIWMMIDESIRPMCLTCWHSENALKAKNCSNCGKILLY